jgi:hypothetical protein
MLRQKSIYEDTYVQAVDVAKSTEYIAGARGDLKDDISTR